MSNIQRRHWFRRKVCLLAVIFAILIFFIGKHFFWLEKKSNPPPDKIVEVITLKKQDMQQTIRLLGTIHPKHAAVLVAKGSGVLDALISTGQPVIKGSLIAKIDNVDIEKNLQLFVSTKALAKAQYERLQPLLKKGFVSAKEIEEKKQLWIEARKAWSKTRIERNDLRFYAPFDGVVGAWKKREGAQVSQGDPVVTVYDPKALTVDFDIPCSNLTRITEGQSVYVSGQKYTLTHFQKMLDEDTHMCPADVDIVCKNCLIGSTVDVDLVVAEKKSVVSIPFQAIFLRNSQPFVYIVKAGKVALVAVKTGLKQENRIEIKSGLQVGQQLIIKGQERLFPDMPVNIYKPPRPTNLS